MPVHQVSHGVPRLEFADAARQAALGPAYEAALRNLLELNAVAYDPDRYNRTGLMADPPGRFFRAGGGYEQPWTRDAAINAWNAGSLLAPDLARNTLWSVVERLPDGRLTVQRDNQWWDQVIWAVGAEAHYNITGDRSFLHDAYATVRTTLAFLRQTRFDAGYGLFQGPAVMQDGIGGYPAPPYQPGNSSSFVLHHPGAARMMCLSTNCLYAGAYQAAARMADHLGRPRFEQRAHLAAATSLVQAINTRLWIPDQGRYGYFRHGTGKRSGQLDTHQESCGAAFAVIFDVADRARQAQLLAGHHHQPRGVVNVWPHFERYCDARPGRHEVMVWPMVQGMWAHAAALGGRVDLFAREMADLAFLVGAGGHFFELYDSLSGRADGGWQSGARQVSQPDQTWSATAYLRMVYAGLFGMRFLPDRLSFAPSLPTGWGTVRLTGLRYRAATLTVTLTGRGHRIRHATLDGHRPTDAAVPAHLAGNHELAVGLA